jgi:hypothetical protein
MQSDELKILQLSGLHVDRYFGADIMEKVLSSATDGEGSAGRA